MLLRMRAKQRVSWATCLAVVGLVSLTLSAKADDLKVFRNLYQAQQYDEAYRVLSSKLKKDLGDDARALSQFGLGLTAFQQKNYSEAIKHLEASLKLNTRLTDYANYFIGESYYHLKDSKNARKYLGQVLNHRPRSSQRYDARYLLGHLAMERGHWRTARNHFRYLERRERSSERYPTIVLNLVRTEIKRRRKWVACRWARKLYRKYPATTVTADWGIDLHKVEIDGKRLGCMASHRDQEKRIRNLQHNGQSDRARKEIETLLNRATQKGRYHAESLLAGFLTNEGFVKDALKLLLPYYEERKGDFEYLMSFAKASGRAEEYQAAIGTYYRAYEVNKSRRKGRNALFKSSFLSYQSKDYDGALRKFEEFNRRYKRSRLSRDARWYIGWNQYLRGNYEASASYFKKMTRGKWWRRRNPKTTRKAKYWRAMGHLKSGQLQEAKSLFENLSDDGLVNYYALASLSRLEQLKDIKSRGLAMDEADVLEEEEEAIAEAEVIEEDGEAAVLNDTESDEEENIAAQDPTDIEEEEKLVVTSFKDPRLAKRFRRASDLEALGFYDMAKWELFAIERRTRNQDYLRALMNHYNKIGAYHRAAYVGEIYFVSERRKKGIEMSRSLWERTYPQAFKESVETFAGSFNIPKELVWAIMRAESHFKSDARSPVGALGLMQIMPYTGRRVAKLLSINAFETDGLLEPDINIRLGARYLKRLSDKFQGNIVLVAAAYNAGPHRVDRWLKSFGHLDMDEFIEHIPYFQTREYAKKVSRNFYVYRALYGDEGLRKKPLMLLSQPLRLPVTDRPTAREDWSDIEGA